MSEDIRNQAIDFDFVLAARLADPNTPEGIIIISRFARIQEVIPQEKLDAIVAALKADESADAEAVANLHGVAINTCADMGDIERAAEKAGIFRCELCDRWLSTDVREEDGGNTCEDCQECIEEELDEEEAEARAGEERYTDDDIFFDDDD